MRTRVAVSLIRAAILQGRNSSGEDDLDTPDLTKIIAVGGLIGASGLFVLFIMAEWFNPKWTEVAFDHFRATIGLPAAAAASFVVVRCSEPQRDRSSSTRLASTLKGHPAQS